MRKTLIFSWMLLAAAAAGAHEFWMLPDRFAPDAAAPRVALALSVGQDFQGERVAFSQPLVAQFVDISATGRRDLGPGVGPGARSEFTFLLRGAGTHLLALTTHPSEIELPAEKFHAYLRQEGLDAIIRQREAAGQAGGTGRERYRRTLKTVLQVGPVQDASYGAIVGQRLEIVPLVHPAGLQPGAELPLRLLFDGQPLQGALARFWCHGSDTLSARSDAQGIVRMKLPAAGVWMVSVVHMVPAADSPRHDWDSYWGNLTFSVAAGAAP